MFQQGGFNQAAAAVSRQEGAGQPAKTPVLKRKTILHRLQSTQPRLVQPGVPQLPHPPAAAGRQGREHEEGGSSPQLQLHRQDGGPPGWNR